MYRRASRLFDELKIARADGTYRTLLARIARVDVLVIDDFAVSPISGHERNERARQGERRKNPTQKPELPERRFAPVTITRNAWSRWRETGSHVPRNAHPNTRLGTTRSCGRCSS
jgi:IstB-like ATP binding protein